MTGPINVVLSTSALKIKNRFILLSSRGVMGTLLAVRWSRQAQVLRVTPSAESVMGVQTLRREGSKERPEESGGCAWCSPSLGTADATKRGTTERASDPERVAGIAYGGERGIRTLDASIGSASCRFPVAAAAISARNAVRHCSPLPTAVRSAENRRIAASESHGVR